MTEPLNAKQGLWTPWAQVLCYGCHGFNFPRHRQNAEGKWEQYTHTISEFEQKRVMKELPVEEGQAITFCDDCGCEIRTYDSVAVEHNLVKALREHGVDAVMAQTGGMNSACSINRKWPEPYPSESSDPEYLVTYNWDGDDRFLIGRYGPDNEWDDQFGLEPKSFEEAVKMILALDDIKYLEEVEK